MLSRAVLTIGLLVFANISNAYILLSANIEDIKKVASKFLSSSVVEQLSSLISKIKTDAKNNLSEENTVNENTVHKISDDEIEERAPIYDKPNKIRKETELRDREINDKYSLESVNKDERERNKYKVSMNKDDTERHRPAQINDETERHRYRPASMNKDETERHRYKPPSMIKHETDRDRHKSESINKDEIERYRHKLASMNKQIQEMSQEDKSFQNVINHVKHDIDIDMLHTTNGLRDRDINDRQEEREIKFKKGRVRDDLYWNDNVADEGVERQVATSGRVKLPNNGKHEYNWEVSSEN